MPDALPEIREADAPPEIAALYTEIRLGMRVPLVNLIYRHLATIPGALPWTWALLRGPVESGALERAQEAIAAQAGTFSREPAPGAAPIPSGLGPSDREGIGSVLDAYDRSNLLNLIGLTAVRQRLHRPASARSAPVVPRPAAARSAPIPSAPPLPRLSDLTGDSAALVRALASRHGASARGVTPSLYLHLSHWPDLLPAVRDCLAPLFAEQLLEGLRDRVVQLAEAEAAALAPSMGPGDPPAAGIPAIDRALETFTRGVIPEMIPVGFTLRRWMPLAAA